MFEPGWYHQLELDVGGDNYFRSGAYVFEDVPIDTSYDPVSMTTASGTTILAGYGDDIRFANRLVSGSGCDAAQAIDALDGGPNGVTWYLGGSSTLTISQDTTIEMIPMLHDDGARRHAVSIHVLDSVWPSTLADGDVVVQEGSGAANRALFQGQIWAPYQSIDLYELTGDANGQITSGVVAAQLLVDSAPGSVGPLGPDLTQADHELLLSATADGERCHGRGPCGRRAPPRCCSRQSCRGAIDPDHRLNAWPSNRP